MMYAWIYSIIHYGYTPQLTVETSYNVPIMYYNI